MRYWNILFKFNAIVNNWCNGNYTYLLNACSMSAVYLFAYWRSWCCWCMPHGRTVIACLAGTIYTNYVLFQIDFWWKFQLLIFQCSGICNWNSLVIAVIITLFWVGTSEGRATPPHTQILIYHSTSDVPKSIRRVCSWWLVIVKKCSNNEENEIEGRKCFRTPLLHHPSEICFIHNGRVQSEFTINQSFLHLSAIANDKRERHWYSLQVYSVTIWIIQQGGSPPLVQNRKSRPSRPFRSSKNMIYSVCSRSPLDKVAMQSRLFLHLV